MARAKKSTKKPQTGAKREFNKSAEIRAYYTTHPDAKPRQVVASMARRGRTVTGQYVSSIRSKMLMDEEAARDTEASPASNQSSKPSKRNAGLGDNFAQLLELKRVADRIGGIEKAQQALQLLQELR